MNKDEALKIVIEDGERLRNLPIQFKKDKQIVLAAVKQNGYSLAHADESLKKAKKKKMKCALIIK